MLLQTDEVDCCMFMLSFIPYSVCLLVEADSMGLCSALLQPDSPTKWMVTHFSLSTLNHTAMRICNSFCVYCFLIFSRISRLHYLCRNFPSATSCTSALISPACVHFTRQQPCLWSKSIKFDADEIIAWWKGVYACPNWPAASLTVTFCTATLAGDGLELLLACMGTWEDIGRQPTRHRFVQGAARNVILVWLECDSGLAVLTFKQLFGTDCSGCVKMRSIV